MTGLKKDKIGSSSKIVINYKRLRRINPEAARTAVLEYLQARRGNISETAKVFGLTRAVIYDIIRKREQGSLQDRPRAPRRVANRTPRPIEQLVISIRQQEKLGPKAISFKLYKEHQIDLSYGTIRGILRRADKVLDE